MTIDDNIIEKAESFGPREVSLSLDIGVEWMLNHDVQDLSMLILARLQQKFCVRHGVPTFEMDHQEKVTFSIRAKIHRWKVGGEIDREGI